MKAAVDKNVPDLMSAIPREEEPGSNGCEYSKIITYIVVVFD